MTEVVDANEFYVQRVNEPRVQWLADQLAQVAQADGPVIPVRVLMRMHDTQWYLELFCCPADALRVSL